MIKIFTGDDRVRAQKEIVDFLGSDYEIIEGVEIELNDLPSIFNGGSLFSETRRILIRDFGINKTVFEKIEDYAETLNEVVIWEMKLDKRSGVYKNLKDKVEIKEFNLAQNSDFGLVFDIYKTAKYDGKKAVAMLKKIEKNEEPIQFCGLLISQALKDYKNHPGAREKRVLLELSKLDLNLKSTSTQPWLLLQGFLLQVSSL